MVCLDFTSEKPPRRLFSGGRPSLTPPLKFRGDLARAGHGGLARHALVGSALRPRPVGRSERLAHVSNKRARCDCNWSNGSSCEKKQTVRRRQPFDALELRRQLLLLVHPSVLRAARRLLCSPRLSERHRAPARGFHAPWLCPIGSHSACSSSGGTAPASEPCPAQYPACPCCCTVC